MEPNNNIKKEAREQRRDLRREARDSRKMQRAKAKTDIARERVSGEADEYGIDLTAAPKVPLTSSAKEKMSLAVTKQLGQEYADDVKGFNEGYVDPAVESTPKLDEQALVESAKRERRARWVDALKGFGAGLQGRYLPEEEKLTKQLEQERRSQFEQYRDVTERNKKSREAWENRYRDDLIEHLRQKAKDETESEEKRKKWQKAADDLHFKRREMKLKEDELKARKEGRYYSPKTSSSSKKTPMYTLNLDGKDIPITETKYTSTSVLNNLGGISPTVLNEYARLSGYPVDDEGKLKGIKAEDKNDLAEAILSNMIEPSRDDDGNITYAIKPGMEGYLKTLTTTLKDAANARKEYEKKEEEFQKEYRDARSRKKDDVEAKFAAERENAKNKYEFWQSAVKDMMEGKISPFDDDQETPTPEEEDVDIFEDFTK